jgi:hypothetical protein
MICEGPGGVHAFVVPREPAGPVPGGAGGRQTRIARMHGMLLKELGEDPDRTEERCRTEGARGYGRGK